MKPTTYLLSLLILLLGAVWSPTTAQETDWRIMIQNQESYNFYDIQEAYEREMGDVPYSKGLGIKQYKRWEYYWQNRVDEDGKFPEAGHLLEEMQRYYASQGQQKSYLVGSGNWSLLGPIAVPNNGTGQLNGNGRLNCIAFHPTDADVIYVGAPSGGFWKSSDGGTSWTKFITGMTRLGVSAIVVHPTNPNIIYIGTGDRDGSDVAGYGVWRSTNGGLSWAPRNSGMGNLTINDMLMDPNNPDILIAAASNNRIYRSTNGGASWTASASLGNNPKDIAMHPTSTGIIYAAGTRFHRSIDGGATWTQITAGVPTGVQRMALAVSPDEPNWVYILAGASTGLNGIYRSTASGGSFSLRTNTPNILGYSPTGNDNASQAWYDLVIAADPNNANIIYTGGVNLWKSTNGGSTMTNISYWVGPSGGADGVHADQHALEFSPLTGKLYNGNDGGLYASNNGGSDWTDLSSGLAIAQLYKIGVSQQTQDLVINGYQDNGTGINRGTDFTTEIGGDGMECIIDPSNDQYMYGALYYGDIRRSSNNGTSFSGISGSITEQGAWVTPYALDPNNSNRMFAGYDNVWRNTAVKTGTAWTKISGFTNTANIRDIAVAPSNSNVVYISKYDNSFRVSYNALSANPTWTDRSSTLPVNASPLDIAIDPNDFNRVLIALNRNIYESNDGGISWTDISNNLPNINLNTIVIDKNSPMKAMYVGMDVGVYYRDNNSPIWQPYSTSLPNIEITELEIHYDNGSCKSTLYAATYGQGLWKSDLKAPINTAPIACFDASTTNTCTGTRVDFENTSANGPTSYSWSIFPNNYYYTNGTNSSSANPSVIFTAAGTYSVTLSVSNSVGSNALPKPNYITTSSTTAVSSLSGLKEDFESQNNCSTSANCGSTNCSISGIWRNASNGSEDDIDWRIDNGGTPSSSTGPSVDRLPGTTAGKYAYMETSGGCANKEALLISDCIYLDRYGFFVFHYHAYGATIGSLHLDFFVDGNWIEDVATPISGNQGNSWRTMSASISPYFGKTIQVRIRGYSGTSYTSDLALDELYFKTSSSPTTTTGTTPPLTTVVTDVEAACTGNGTNQLSWTLSDDPQKGSYSIQKYIQGTWETVEEITAQKGQRSHVWEDHAPFLGENLYRVALNSAAKDAQPKFSEIAATNCAVDIERFVVFPNPFREEISLQFYAPMAAQLPYRITNTLGQVLYQGNFQAQEGDNSFILPTRDLPKGLYLLHTQDKTVKLIKN